MADWAEYTDTTSGRKYYYNATTGATSWDVPEGFGASAADSGASDWQQLHDASSGKYYYYNAKTGATQWDAPAGFSGGSSAGAAASSEPRATTEEPAATRRSVAARKSMVSRRTTIAKRSTAKPQTVEEKLAQRAKKFVQMRKAEKAKSQPSAFARKRGTAAGGITGGAKAAAAAASASAWQPVLDADSGKTYYYNSTTGETSWELPA